jgi:uncharacterized protein YegP (UPF0339 family)
VPAYFELCDGAGGELYFTLRAANHAVLLTSGAHASKAAALDAIELVRVYAPIYTQYQREHGRDRCHHFTLVATAGVVLGRSLRYESPTAMDRSITAVMLNAGRAMVRELRSAAGD